MGYNVKILKDSVAPCGSRLTTFELSFPKFILAQFNTHRLLSRNAASSRAIPIKKVIRLVEEDPVFPIKWGKNQKGMQAHEELSEDETKAAKAAWENMLSDIVHHAKLLERLGLHKQIVNRPLELFQFVKVIVSATEYDNFFYLRNNEHAQPEIAWVAREMEKAYNASEPLYLRTGEWHLPLVTLAGVDDPLFVPAGIGSSLKKISTARCARVSYLTHDGKRDYDKDIELHDRLVRSGHWSPFEHVAQALSTSERSGNFIGWKQYRKEFANEHYGSRMP